MKFNMIYQPSIKIRTVLALLCAVSISLFLISGTQNKSKSLDKFDREIIIRHLNQIKPTELENYISTDKLLTTNPKARIFTIHYAFKKWGDIVRSNPEYYYYLISDYLLLKKADATYVTYHKIYDLKHSMKSQDIEKMEKNKIAKELYTLLHMYRITNFEDEWLRPFVVNKASEFLNNHPELTEDQRELPERIIQTAKNIKEKQKKMADEIEYVRNLAQAFKDKESEFLEKKDYEGLKTFYLNNCLDKNDALQYSEVSYRVFSIFKKIEFKVNGVVKVQGLGYFVKYSWKTVPPYETIGDPNYSGSATSTFQLKNDKLILVD